MQLVDLVKGWSSTFFSPGPLADAISNFPPISVLIDEEALKKKDLRLKIAKQVQECFRVFASNPVTDPIENNNFKLSVKDFQDIVLVFILGIEDGDSEKVETPENKSDTNKEKNVTTAIESLEKNFSSVYGAIIESFGKNKTPGEIRRELSSAKEE